MVGMNELANVLEDVKQHCKELGVKVDFMIGLYTVSLRFHKGERSRITHHARESSLDVKNIKQDVEDWTSYLI